MDLRILDCQIATRSKSKSRFDGSDRFLTSFDPGLAVRDLTRLYETFGRVVDSHSGKSFRPRYACSAGTETRSRRFLVDFLPRYHRAISIAERLGIGGSSIFRLWDCHKIKVKISIWLPESIFNQFLVRPVSQWPVTALRGSRSRGRQVLGEFISAMVYVQRR